MSIEIYCLNCLKSIREQSSLKEIFTVDDLLCAKCRYMLKYQPKMIKIDNLKIQGLYRYEGLVRKLLIQYKEYNDEALAYAFLYPYIKELKGKYKGKYIVKVPSSDLSYQKRGFDHVYELFSLLDLPFLDVLYNDSEKQQKQLDHNERKKIVEHIHLKDGHINMQDKDILLVDDILTTGASMKASYDLLREKCKSITGLVIAYNEIYLSKIDKLLYELSH